MSNARRLYGSIPNDTYASFFSQYNAANNPNGAMNWPGVTSPVYYYVGSEGSPPRYVWAPSSFKNSEWIGYDTTTNPAYSAGQHLNRSIFYKYTFNLDSAVDISSFQLKLNITADDYVKEVYVNNQPQVNVIPMSDETNSNALANFRSATLASVVLSKDWISGGSNTIIVRTRNLSNPLGLMIQAEGSKLCTNNVSVTKNAPKNLVANSFGTIDFTVNVNNLSKSTQSVTLNDPIPAGVTSYTWTCSPNAGVSAAQAICPAASGNSTSSPLTGMALNNMPAGSSLRFNIIATTGGTLPPLITNTATIVGANCTANSTDPDCSASASVPTAPMVDINKTVSPPANGSYYYPGETVTFKI